jgi:3-phenylpropionate/trans-cinnamate dioxygenase ferredoxin reductase component
MADRKVDYLLIGGGLASGNCARWLRESGAEGSILLVGREPDLPYNRPDCSKGYMQGKASRDEVLFRAASWYPEQDVEAMTRVSVMALDTDARVAKLSNREEIEFGQALLATGANVRRLSADGTELEGIHYLRTLGNADTIRDDAAGKRVVLIGGSYIACEVAASLTELGSTCTLLMMEQVTLSRGFGDLAGGYFQRVLEDHGITVHGGDELERFEGSDGRVSTVVTKGGLRLDADAVVVGVGVTPDVSLARAAGLGIGERGGVEVDSRLQAPVPGVFAAGDIAEYESVVHGGARLRVEHWDVAFNMGKTVALNMIGRDVPHDVVPYFFSDLSDWASLEYVGPASTWDREVVRGSIDDGQFSLWYLRGGSVAAALSVGRSDDLEAARRLIASPDRLPDSGPELLADLSSDLSEL